jgi:ABC-type transporter Mla subunit MlaD
MDEFRKSRVKVDRALDGASVVLEGVAKVMGSDGAGGMVATVQTILERVQLTVAQGRENLVESLAYLRATAENMAVFSEKIREDPSLLLLGGGDGDEEF